MTTLDPYLPTSITFLMTKYKTLQLVSSISTLFQSLTGGIDLLKAALLISIISFPSSVFAQNFDEKLLQSLLKTTIGSQSLGNIITNYPYFTQHTYSHILTIDHQHVIQISCELQIQKLISAQLDENYITQNLAELTLENIDRIELVFTFSQSENVKPPTKSIYLYAHCKSGKFKTFLLPKSFQTMLSQGKALPKIDLTYDNGRFICKEW